MMNERSTPTAAPHLLCGGQSIRSVARVTGAQQRTRSPSFWWTRGKACMAYHDDNVQDMEAQRVQAAGRSPVPLCRPPLQQIGRDTSELQSLMRISYAVFCLKKKTHIQQNLNT